MGPVYLKEVEKAQSQICDILRQLVDKGEIKLVEEQEEMVE